MALFFLSAALGAIPALLGHRLLDNIYFFIPLQTAF
jgi:hypothetical protein